MDVEIFQRLFGGAPARGLAATGCGHCKFRFLREHMKLHAGSNAAALIGAAVVEADGGNEFHKLVAFGQRVTDERIGVRAEAEGHRFARDAHWFAAGVFIHIHIAKSAGGSFPFQRGQARGHSGGVDQRGLGPVGPITAETIAAIGDDEVQFLRAGDVGLELGGAGFFCEHFGNCRRLGASHFAGGFGAGIAFWLGPAATFFVEVFVQIFFH